MLRVASIDYLDLANTDGVAMTIWFKGCFNHCVGCQNEELQLFDGGTLYTPKSLYELIREQFDTGGYNYLGMLGGDALSQDMEDMEALLNMLYDSGIKVFLYTGLDYDIVPQFVKDKCYCVKAGNYNPIDFPPQPGNKLASSNQAYYYKDGRIIR